MNDIKKLYEMWLEKATADKDLIPELLSIKNDEEAILDRFYKDLEFGTAGLRGVLGAGTNRMNVYTVGRATQGLADYLNSNFKNPSVAIAYDSRIKSNYLSKCAASVLAANGIKVYIYPELVPTPMLSFAVRYFKCSSGIILTASHNPAKYNGYKCYDPNGYQMTDEAAKKTYEFIEKVDTFSGVKTVDFEKSISDGIISYIGKDVFEAFYDEVLKAQVNKGICEKVKLSIIYTPLNGTGNKPVREIFKRMGASNITVVKTQELPDGDFPTCPFPNPEIKQAFEEGEKVASELSEKADLIIATDPDCDRIGIAVLEEGEYKLMSGNEVGALLTHYLLSELSRKNVLPKNPIIVKTIVTSKLIEVISEKFGAKTADLLTGFKYIGELITELEKRGEENRFVLGMEESYGYLRGVHARDKDAVVAALMIVEMASFYKLQGKSLYDVMQEIYAEYGNYTNTLLNFYFEGAAGMQKMSDMMAALRQNPPAEISGLKVLTITDYKSRERIYTDSGKIEKIELPSSNVLSYALEGGNMAIVRPSGTEPKLKAYITAVADTKVSATKLMEKICEDVKRILGV